MTRFRCVYIKERAGLAPQCPSMRFLMCSGLSGSRRRGLSCKIDHPQRQVIAGTPKGVRLARFFVAERSAFNCGARDPDSCLSC